jgi:protein tyrosine phosphatase (PTP) superfamily phosphohydrolase (DUF442 family)
MLLRVLRLRTMLPRLRANITWRATRRAVVLLVVTAFVLEALRVLAWTNRHTVIAGKVYRCSQPNASAIASHVRDHDIKTVINLRGYCPGPEAAWYAEEVRATFDAKVSQEDITLSANRLPSPSELKQLITVLDRSEYPILIHCKRGADRTGLVSALVMLLYSDTTLARARWQLLPRYGHFRFGRTAAMDEFVDRYETWLADRTHTSTLVREWATTHYRAGPHHGTLLRSDGKTDSQPIVGVVNQWTSIPLVATNESDEPWELKPGSYTGIAVEMSVHDPSGAKILTSPHGLLQRRVMPGESLQFTVLVPPMKTPGKYAIRLDLINSIGAGVPIRQMGFYQFGGAPLILSFDIQSQ